MRKHIYLDYNASTPLREGVILAMREAFEHYGNPSSIHKFGRTARNYIETARDELADVLGIRSWQVVFTSGGTEANNLVMKAATQENRTVLMSAIEHESIERSVPNAIKIPVTRLGQINLEALEDTLQKIPEGAALVAVMLANNETGIIQPIADVVKLSRQYGAKIHCDAVTAFTKIPFTYDSLGVDYLSLSAHKVGGPKGIGALIIPSDKQLPSLIHGGGQEKGHRAGTENMVGIVGFATAVKESVDDDWQSIEALRNQLEEEILEHTPDAPIYGRNTLRLPNTSYIGMPGVPTHKQLIAFDLEGYAVSSGSACSSGKVMPSHVLKAMGIDQGPAQEALRISLGWLTTPEDVEEFPATWQQLYQRLK